MYIIYNLIKRGEIMSKKYFKIPYELMQLELSSSAILLYGILLNLAFSDDVYATNAYLAKELKCTVRTIQSLLQELVKANAISIREDKNNRYIKPLILCEVVITKKEEPRTYKSAGFETL